VREIPPPDGNLFVGEVFNSRAQKFRPAGADPSQLMGKQMRVA
jgi:hypothetical protein